MPSNTIVMPIDIKQNRNALSKVYGHYFPEVHCRQTLSTYGLAKHMADHGSLVSEEVLRLVLGQLVKCVPELLAQGVPVKLDGLGIFRPYAKSVPGGAASVEEASQMGANNLVDGIRIRFIPESEDLRDLTRKVFKKKCALRLDNVIELTNVEDTDPVSGETVVKRRLRNYTPLADYGLADGSDGDQGGGDDEPRP